ncbi:HNH/ENDO VII family nuclease [Tractidigestivibacter scatoligenes]|jgi:hypothetical protein|uniref:HNH/ENDO VII family nuclease n=1 Tax=Tractidigestivibacter scatoligenes TaxID=1299998 RepID=UPI002F3610FA
MLSNKLIVVILTLALTLQGCATAPSNNASSSDAATESTDATKGETVPEFSGMSDTDLPYYVQDSVYEQLTEQLPEGYAVEDIHVRYVSQEYIEELSANSQENIYYGHTISELQDAFQGNKYVFALGDKGQTTVRAFEAYDNAYEKVVKNVAIGTGAILVCATISVATSGSAPLVSVVLASAANTGTTIALSSGGIAAAIAGITTGVETGDVEEAAKAAAISGSEEFKWGAITGSALATAGGAATVKKAGGADAFYRATKNGLTVAEVYQIQKESHYPLDVIEQFKSMDEYNIYKDAGLKARIVNGRTALVRDIDLDKTSEFGGKTVTNLERMNAGGAPVDTNGNPYELHHINQKADGTLAMLTKEEHDQPGILNTPGIMSEVEHGSNWDKTRKTFYKALARTVSASN